MYNVYFCSERVAFVVKYAVSEIIRKSIRQGEIVLKST